MMLHEIPPSPPLRFGILGVGSVGLDAVRRVMPYPPLTAQAGEMTYGHMECGPDEATHRTVTKLPPTTERPENDTLSDFWEGIDLAMIVFGYHEPGARAQALRAATAAHASAVFTLVVCGVAETAWLGDDNAAFQRMTDAFNKLGIAPIFAVIEADALTERPTTRNTLPMLARSLEAFPRLVSGYGLICVDLFDVRCAMDRWRGITLMGTGKSASTEPADVREAVHHALRQIDSLGFGMDASGMVVDLVHGPHGSLPVALDEISAVIGPRMTGPKPVVIGQNFEADLDHPLQVTLFLGGVAGFLGHDAQTFNQNRLAENERKSAAYRIDVDSDAIQQEIPEFLRRARLDP